MRVSLSTVIKFCLGGIAILYPVIIFLSFVVFDIQVNHLSILILLFAFLYFLINVTNAEKRKTPRAYISPVMLFLIGCAGILMNSEWTQALFPALAGQSKAVIKLYPMLVNAAWFVVFSSSLIFPPPFVFEIASVFDKSINDAEVRGELLKFSRAATMAWCLFFFIDTIIAGWTIFFVPVVVPNEHESDTIWGIYNGAVTYIAMGVITFAQIIMAKRIINRARAASE